MTIQVSLKSLSCLVFIGWKEQVFRAYKKTQFSEIVNVSEKGPTFSLFFKVMEMTKGTELNWEKVSSEIEH